MKRTRSPDRPNRWAEQMDRDESWVSAAAMWVFYAMGATLLTAATFGILVSIVFIGGAPDGSVETRVAAVIGLIVSLAGFWVGRRLSDDYRVRPKRRAR